MFGYTSADAWHYNGREIHLSIRGIEEQEKGSLMGNPLDSLTGTIILGLVITVVMILVVNGIGA